MITIRYGQHATVSGTVGSGKTWFGQNAIAPMYDRLIVLDSEEDDWPFLPNVSVKKAIRLAASDYSFYVRVPTQGARELDETTLDALSFGILDKGHDLCLLIEECADYSDRSYMPVYLKALMRRARHRKVSVVASTQRLQETSMEYYSLSVHHFFFFLSDNDVTAPSVSRYAPMLKARMGEIPYESYRCLYQAPDGTVRTLPPAKRFDWSKRLRKR